MPDDNAPSNLHAKERKNARADATATPGLARSPVSASRQGGLARPWAWAAAAALVIGAGVFALRYAAAPQFGPPIAQLSRKGGTATVVVQISTDGRSLALHASQSVSAPDGRSYQLWVLPEDRPAVALAVLPALDAVLPISAAQRAQMRDGAALAITAEPPGGSPTGQPGGEIVVAGTIFTG